VISGHKSYTSATLIVPLLVAHSSSLQHLTLEELMQGEVARVALIEGSTQEVPTWVMMTKRPTQQVLTQVESGTILIRDVLT
jgi:hypothetical protein